MFKDASYLGIVFAMILVLTGCQSDPNTLGVTNPNQPGPQAGRATGAVVGGVAANTAGFVVGTGEGVAAATGKVFNNRSYSVRKWETITTEDGRTIQVPVDIWVDENGVPIRSSSKKSKK